MYDRGHAGYSTKVTVFVIAAVAAILVFGSWWMGQNIKRATEDAVRSVSMFYLDELAGRREQVVEANLNNAIDNMKTAISLLSSEATFCNLYTSDGVPLTNMVLGGLASEDNLLDALQMAQFEGGASLDSVVRDFQEGNSGIVSFTYNGVQETLAYVPVPNTNWMLTYLIRESVITDQISDISAELTMCSVLQTLLTALVLLVAAGLIIAQTRRNANLAVEREAVETEARVKQEEMERRLALQEQLLDQEKQRAQQDMMITALASDYRSVYYVNLDADEGVPERTREHLEKIGSSARHLLDIINDVLDVSRIEAGRMAVKNEAFSFSRLLEQVNTIISSQCADKGLEYRCKINGTVDDSYIGDDTKLRQTLVNVLGNAVKFTLAGGSVELTVERTARFAGKSTLRFTISDTGVGISEDYLPKIFDTFSQEDSTSTNKYGSTGLGLAITKSMPEMNGLEATMAIRAMDRADAKAVPIIALTANAFDEDVQKSLQAGLTAHLSKPVEPAVLFETLEVLIEP